MLTLNTIHNGSCIEGLQQVAPGSVDLVFADPPFNIGYEYDVYHDERAAGTFKEREGFHGCQMPEQLLGRIIRSCSNPMEVVLDPFGGSGTTFSSAGKDYCVRTSR